MHASPEGGGRHELISYSSLAPSQHKGEYHNASVPGVHPGDGGASPPSRDEETLVRASRSCTSARKAIPICERYWCKVRSIFWVRSALTVISGAGA
jgi:hypothetical protein